MIKLRLFLLSLLLVFFCGCLVSCLPKTGHISWQANDNVEVDLGKGNLAPGFTYYYSGSEALPHTIIGIRGDVPFQQNFWKIALFGGQQVKEWLDAIDNPHRSADDMYFGGQLYDRGGGFLGIWYSKYHFYSGYLDCDGNLVILHPLRREKGTLLQNDCE